MKKLIIAALLVLTLAVFSSAHATITTSTARVSYTCNGTSTNYAYTFKVFDDSELSVTKVNATTGAETPMILNTDYTVTGVGVTGGGNVALTAATKCASGYRMTIIRNIPLTQSSDYVDGEVFSAESFENDLDRTIMVQQQQGEQLNRVPMLPKTSTTVAPTLANPIAGQYLRWNTAGTGIESTAAVSSTGTFTQSGTGAVARTVDAKIGETVFSSKDFGALGGGADDTAAVRLAIAAIPSTGGVLELADSIYSGTMVIDKNNVTVDCKGRGETYSATFAPLGGGTEYEQYNVMFAVTGSGVKFQNCNFYQGSFTSATIPIWFAATSSHGLVDETNRFVNLKYVAGQLGAGVLSRPGSHSIVMKGYYENCGSATVIQGDFSRTDGAISYNAVNNTNGGRDATYSIDGGSHNSIVNSKFYRGSGTTYSGSIIHLTNTTGALVENVQILGLNGGVAVKLYANESTTATGVTKSRLSNIVVDGGNLAAGGIQWVGLHIDAYSRDIDVDGFKMFNAPTGGAVSSEGILVSPTNVRIMNSVLDLGAVTSYANVYVVPAYAGNEGYLEIERNRFKSANRGVHYAMANRNEGYPMWLKGNIYDGPMALAISVDPAWIPDSPLFMENEKFTGAITTYVSDRRTTQQFAAGAYKYPFTIGPLGMVIHASTAPTNADGFVKSFDRGDIVWNSSPTVGQPIGWMCSTAGTFSSATDNVGDTTNGSAVITDAAMDTSDFYIGNYVTVSAGFASTGPFKIIAKTATSITVDATANSSQNNVTVATPDPVWTALANL